MPLPREVDSRVSDELAAFMAPLLDNPDLDAPATLGFIHHRLADAAKLEPRRFAGVESLLAELEALIEEFGTDAWAADFVAVKASEDLSRCIEALLDMSDAEVVPTLGGIRAALAAGWVARLAGDGVIDDDEDQTLLAEMDALIQRYGEDTPAESVLRFE